MTAERGPAGEDPKGVMPPVVSFRMSFWWFFVVVVAWSIPLGVFIGVTLVLALGAWAGNIDYVVLGLAVLVATAVGEALTALLVLLMMAYYRVYVGPEGVRGFNFWGIYRFAPWADFRSVAPVNFLGLRFLRAQTVGSWAPLWLPLFLADWAGFCHLVRTHAGAAHPLAVALGEEGPQ